MNADVNGAVNIRRKITQTLPTGDMSNGCLARPGVYLFDTTTGAFHPKSRQTANPNIPTLGIHPACKRVRMSTCSTSV